MKAMTMNISLPVELVAFIREKVAGGGYASASEVVREGLRLLQRSENGGGKPSGDEFDRAKVVEALAGLRRLAETQSLGAGLSLRELIDEGRS
jgi:Arc/MetJ-type ribon-helix-helix transcriptional regulator